MQEDIDKALEAHKEALLLAVSKHGLRISAMEARITDTLVLGLHSDRAQHKQWALWHIAEILGLTHFLNDVEDRGIAP